VRYLRLPRLLGELALARGDGSYGCVLQQLAKTDLVILDDWGLAPLGDRERRDLLELIEDRSGRCATLITSQVPTSPD
jgi:DNA replication protein DnaC